jgi:hypothetical protein
MMTWRDSTGTAAQNSFGLPCPAHDLEHPARQLEDFPPALLEHHMDFVDARPAPHEHRAALAAGEEHVHAVRQEFGEIAALAAVPPKPFVDLLGVLNRGPTNRLHSPCRRSSSPAFPRCCGP